MDDESKRDGSRVGGSSEENELHVQGTGAHSRQALDGDVSLRCRPTLPCEQWQ